MTCRVSFNHCMLVKNTTTLYIVSWMQLEFYMEVWSEEAPHVIDNDDLASKLKCPFNCGTKA